VKISRIARFTAIGVAASMLLVGCAANEPTTPPTTTDPTTPALSGELSGVGASAQEVAITAWTTGIQTAHQGVTINYDPQGSGTGRTSFMNGAADFAGSDRAFRLSEIEAGPFMLCEAGSNIIQLPTYISPFAVVFNLDGIDSLNLDAATISRIFMGEITNWNDPAIAAHNAGVSLPNQAIVAVHRSDNSGTTENFTDYLSKASGGVWKFDPHGDWPMEGGEAANGTSGVISAVEGANGGIGYADASRITDKLGTVAVKVGDVYVPFSPEAAAKTIDVSPFETGRTAGDLAVAIDRNTTAAGAYPLVLISYLIACENYVASYDKVDLVKAFLTHAASVEGQAASAAAAGSAPIGDAVRTRIMAAIDSIN
jgi:phosphate transport system substrate-binding protein